MDPVALSTPLAADGASDANGEAAAAPDRDLACFRKIYVPAKWQVDTKGKLVQPAGKKFEVVQDGGKTHWNYVRDPAVYLETRQLIEPDHYTLEPAPCVRPSYFDADATPRPLQPEGHGTVY